MGKNRRQDTDDQFETEVKDLRQELVLANQRIKQQDEQIANLKIELRKAKGARS
jgi:hypothetical protein